MRDGRSHKEAAQAVHQVPELRWEQHYNNQGTGKKNPTSVRICFHEDGLRRAALGPGQKAEFYSKDCSGNHSLSSVCLSAPLFDIGDLEIHSAIDFSFLKVIFMHKFVHVPVCICVRVCMCAYVFVHMCVCALVCTCPYVYKCTCMCMCVCVHVCAYVSICVCHVCICVNV